MGITTRLCPRSAALAATLLLGAAACGGDDGYGLPPGDDDPTEPDARAGDGGEPDADPGAPDGSLVDAPPDATGDGAAPLITIVAPEPGGLVRGVMTLEVTAIDDDGIADVTATIAGVHEIPMASAGGSTYRGTFDTAPLAGLVAPTIVVRARDTTDAASELGFQIVLDNEPPVSDLDPPDVRESKIVEGVLVCSHRFDPLGPDAPDDGEAVPQLFELRARIVDLSNTGTINSTIFIPHAGIATASVFVLDDTTRPLVVDTDGDGVCDAINPEIVPTPIPMTDNEAALVQLAAADPVGDADFRPGATFGGDDAVACSPGDEENAPASACHGEPWQTRIIASTIGDVPQVYGVSPVSEHNCMGFAFDARAANIADGWACAAVRATDALGNTGVSAPLRVCVDSDGDQAECAAWGTIAAEAQRPDCTGTYDPTTGVVSSAPCTLPEPFPAGAEPDDLERILRL